MVLVHISDLPLQKPFLAVEFPGQRINIFTDLIQTVKMLSKTDVTFSHITAMINICFNTLPSSGNVMVQSLWKTGCQFLVKFYTHASYVTHQFHH